MYILYILHLLGVYVFIGHFCLTTTSRGGFCKTSDDDIEFATYEAYHPLPVFPNEDNTAPNLTYDMWLKLLLKPTCLTQTDLSELVQMCVQICMQICDGRNGLVIAAETQK